MSSLRDRGRPPHPDVLTPGEWRVVDAVRHGLGNREIARRQGVSIDAVKYHVDNALHKLGLPSRAALRRWNGVRRDSRLHAQEIVMQQDFRLAAIGQIARTVGDIAAARGIRFTHAPHMIHRHADGREEWMAFFDDNEGRPIAIMSTAG